MRKRWEVLQNSSHRFTITKIAVYPPFNVWSIPMVSKMQNFMCKFPIMSWKQHITMSMASVFPGSSRILRCLLSFFPGSHHMPWQLIQPYHVYKITHNVKFHASPRNKTQDMYMQVQTMSNNIQSNHNTKTWFMMSPSDLAAATPTSEWLQERCSRHRHWETKQNEPYANYATPPTNPKLLKHSLNAKLTQLTLPPFELRRVSGSATSSYEIGGWTSSRHKSTILPTTNLSDTHCFRHTLSLSKGKLDRHLLPLVCPHFL